MYLPLMRGGSLDINGIEIGVVMEGARAGISPHFLGYFLHYYGMIMNIFRSKPRWYMLSELLHLPSYLGGDLH